MSYESTRRSIAERLRARPQEASEDTEPVIDIHALRSALSVDEPQLKAPPRPPKVKESKDGAAGEGNFPTPGELLESSPNVVRLCEAYENSRQLLIRRNRSQRLGIAALVSALAVGSTILAYQGRLDIQLVVPITLTAAIASTFALGALFVLWLRDERRLRNLQGERLIRALRLNSTLAPERLELVLNHPDLSTVFFRVHAAWAAQHSHRVFRKNSPAKATAS